MLAGQSGTVNAGSGAAGDLSALFFGHPWEDGDEQGSDWATGIEPGLSDADDLDTKTVEVEDLLDVADHRSAQAVDCEDDDGFELTSVSSGFEPLPLRPVFDGAGVLVEHGHDFEPTSGCNPLQRRKLVLGVLPVG